MNGTIDNAGTITLAGSANFIGGTINNQSAALLDIQGIDNAEYPFVFATINNSGTIKRSVSTGTVGIWTLDNASGGVIDVETGTLIPWEGQNGVTTGATFVVAAGATMQFATGNGASINEFTGTYTGSGAGTIALNSGRFAAGIGGATIDFPGTMFQWTGGIMDVGLGDLTSRGTINVAGPNDKFLTNGGTLDDFGTIVQSGAGAIRPEGLATTLKIEPAASYLIESDSGADQTNIGLAAIDNAGTIKKTAGTGTSTIQTAGLSNTGTIEVVSGTLKLSGGVTQVSGSTLTAGTWNAMGGSAIQLPVNTAINTNLATIALAGPGATITGIDGLAASSGSFALTNGASFTTSGAFSNTGGLTVGAGSTFSVHGNYAQGASATLEVDIGGSAASKQFGVLAVTGAATLAGAVKTTLLSGFDPAAGNNYTIATYAGQTGGGSLSFEGVEQGRFAFFEPTVGSTAIVLGTTTSAADLAADSFSVPATATAGGPFSFTYQVSNPSTIAAAGNWVDSFYLSTTQRLSPSSTLVARVPLAGGLAANGQYSKTVNATLPPVAATNYWVIEVADSQGLVPDVNRANNIAASAQAIQVSVPSLTLGSTTSGTISSGQGKLFQINLPAGDDVHFHLNTGVPVPPRSTKASSRLQARRISTNLPLPPPKQGSRSP